MERLLSHIQNDSDTSIRTLGCLRRRTVSCPESATAGSAVVHGHNQDRPGWKLHSWICE